MQHSFDINIAVKYGVQPAVLLNNIYFWVEKSRANGKNFFDGHYWVYNSKKAFKELFPYMTERQIDYALQKLIDNGLIVTGNYNKSAFDRTMWYAITKKGYSILQNCEMEETILSNGNDKIVKPIPDSNTDSKTDINNNTYRACAHVCEGEFSNTFANELNAFCKKWEVTIDNYSSLLAELDFKKLDTAYGESTRFLQVMPFAHTSSWIVRNANSIYAGKYKDAPVDSDNTNQSSKGYWDDELDNLGRLD